MSDLKFSVGDEINGFRLEQIDELPDYHGLGYLFKHVRTGMEVYQVANDDRELFFSYVFRTTPTNDSGVAHIIEHSVLSGSEKYPLRDPFMELQKGSANTFMNALTYPEKTLFPGASPLPKDFEHLFKVYTDAVFAPLLREETFLQEGIRLTCDDDDNFRFEGVVFNEMLGDFSDAGNVIFSSIIRMLFPDSLYSFVSGGDPAKIINLNYQQFKAYYYQHYHPNNCRLFLYGKLRIGEYFDFLDKEYLSSRSLIQAPPAKLESLDWDTPRTTSVTCPKDGSKGSSVLLAFSTAKSDDSLEVLTLSCLTDLLIGSPGTPLYKAMIDSKLGEDVSNVCGMSSDFYQMPFIVGFSGADPANAEKIEDFLLGKMKEIAKDGFDAEQVAGTLKRLRFQELEIPGGKPMGFVALRRCLRGWLSGHGPEHTIATGSVLRELEKKLKENPRYFEDWMQEHLINNNHRLLLTAVPDEKHLERQKKVIASKLTAMTVDLDVDARKKLREKTVGFEAFQKSSDSPEVLSTIPHLHIDDLPREIIPSVHKKSSDLGCVIWKLEMPTNGISYVNFALHLEDLSMDELLLMPLLNSVFDMSGVGELDYIQVTTKMKNLTGSFQLMMEGGETVDGNEMLCLLGQAKMLDADLEEALGFISRIIREAHMDDLERIWAAVVDSKGIYASAAAYNGHRLASIAASSVFSNQNFEVEYLLGIRQWKFLASLQREDMPRISKELIALQKKLTNRNRLEIHLTCDGQMMNENKKKLHDFIKSFPLGEKIACAERYYPEVAQRKSCTVSIMTLPSDVSYTSMVLPGAGLKEKDNAVQRILASILSGNDLWSVIRGQGGAYGVDCYVENLERLFIFTSYRDPNIASTLSYFRQVLEKYSKTDVDEERLEDAIVSNVSSDLRPFGPAQQSLIDFRRILYGITDDIRRFSRNSILAVTAADVREEAKLLLDSPLSSYAVLTGEQLFEIEKEKLEILHVTPSALPL
ncbi:MAG: insulinase family protein [Spirochaetia bacterium]|nr:insulinase family protein [Spirochaetia bacterium]